jgi:hypothetical protein
MNDPPSAHSESSHFQLSLRGLLKREWPYLLVVVLALFGIAYTSFSRTPMALYWIVLAPLMGVICVVTRWRDIRDRDERLRLIWTQALHWLAVLVATHLVLVLIAIAAPFLWRARADMGASREPRPTPTQP